MVADLDAKKGQYYESETRVTDVSDSEESFRDLVAQEQSHEIKYRTCSWQKTAALLFSEYICLAVLSFPWSYSVLGLVPGILLTIAIAGIVLYTSLILSRFCLRHPHIRDACDIGRMLFGGSQWAYNITAVFFLLNNTFIQALHVLVGAELLNTLTDSAACTVLFALTASIACFFVSLPRTLDQLSGLATFSAASTFVAIILCIIFAGIQSSPAGYVPDTPWPPTVSAWPGASTTVSYVSAWPARGTSYVSGMSAFLNITYTLVGQIALPSFIAEMRDPKEFPKALWAVTIAEIVVYTVCGSLVYLWTGNTYVTAPALGALQSHYRKIAFSFVIPTILFLGALYSSITSRFLFFRIFPNTTSHGHARASSHAHKHTILGWTVWTLIVAATWGGAFVIAEVIPFFSELLALMSGVFAEWLIFIFWGLAYLQLYPRSTRWSTPLRAAETVFNYFLILLGAYVLIAGSYTSIESIVISYRTQKFGSAFTCASNAI
ncbi:transmembrane amino acid transporter protein-domain-containing protein [Hygrophoropsis aurantiaca]|uniref:Transmembrane amino acid transporter protein-domain-containing protein n=1 Tax=Hygrophoropsis aurantiaca TaxID=72124 RepID=A0ACB8A403_9AGAM|nr:transmembrane amino acid transporter protein-domain-containing protein [Hygrophoropsis aurantiaca]